MTGVASRVGYLIVSVRVARLTWCRRMDSRQREFRFVVVERCWLPCSRRVTELTGRCEAPDHMIRGGRGGELGLMASVAIRGSQSVTAVLMTLLACDGFV